MAKQNKTKKPSENQRATITLPTQEKPVRTTALDRNSILYPIILLAILLVYGVLRSKFLEIPLERDEGSYGYIGQLLLDGKMPYIDFYEMKPPALMYSYAALVGIFGASTTGLHLGILFVCLITATLLYFTSKNIFHPAASLLAAAVYLQASLAWFASGFAAQAEHIMALFLVAGLFWVSIARNSNKAWHWILAGIFLANAIMTKQIAAAFLPGALALAWSGAHSPGKWVKDSLMSGIYLALGAALITGFWSLLIFISGSWNEMMFWLFEYPKSYSSVLKWSERERFFWSILKGFNIEHRVIWWISYAGLAALILVPKYRRFFPFVLLLLAGAVISVMPGYYFYGHYWLNFAPALALCAAAGLGILTNYIEQKRPGWTATLIAVATVSIVVIADITQHKLYYNATDFKQITRRCYSDNPFPETAMLSNFLKKLAKPGDQLLVMGSEPQLNFTTGMRSPTRHFFMGFLTKDHAKQATWIAEAKQECENGKPCFLVVTVHPYSWAYSNNSKTEMFDYGFEFANKYYKLIGVADMLPGGTKYVWGNDALNYPTPKDKYLLVYERKEGI